MSKTIKVEGVNFSEIRLRSQKEIQNILESPFFREIISRKESEAYKKGFADGKKQGLLEHSGKVLSLMSTLEALIKKLNSAGQEMVKQLQPQVIQLALKAAERVIGQELVSGTANLQEIIRPALERIPDCIRITIRMNPEEIHLFSEFKEDFFREGKTPTVEIQADPSVQKGGCVVVTDVGTVDATLTTRIGEMVRSIQEG